MAASTYILAVVVLACFSSVMAAKSVKFCVSCFGEEKNCNKGNETTHGSMDCATFQTTPPTSTAHLDAQSMRIFEQFQNNITNYVQEQSKKASAPKMVCLKYTFEHDAFKKPMVYKGCAPDKYFDQDICDLGDNVMAVFNADADGCSTCTKDYCNGAAGFTHSFMIFSFLVPVVYKFFA